MALKRDKSVRALARHEERRQTCVLYGHGLKKPQNSLINTDYQQTQQVSLPLKGEACFFGSALVRSKTATQRHPSTVFEITKHGTAMGRLHLLAKDCFREGHLQGPLFGDELETWSVRPRPKAGTQGFAVNDGSAA